MENEELLFNRYRVSVQEDEKLLEMVLMVAQYYVYLMSLLH